MATLAENAAAVKAAQVAIDAAIVAKGGTTDGGLTNAAAAIASIPSGGGAVRDYPNLFAKYGAPDIRDILDNDDPYGDGIFTEQEVPRNAPRCIILFRCNMTITNDTVFGSFVARPFKYRTYNGFSGTLIYPAIVSVRNYENGFGWIIVYGEDDFFLDNVRGNLVNYSLWFYAKNFTACHLVSPGASSSTAYGNLIADFGDVPVAGAGTYANRARGIFARSISTNQVGLNADVSMLEYVPDIVTCTAGSGTFTLSSHNLGRLPTHLTSSVSVTCANCDMVERDSVAKFDGSGNLIGGMVYNLNNTDTPLTLTLNATIKGYFSAPSETPDGTSEQEKISAALNAKGWTLTW